ncbi:phenylpropionate dioxygenase-like ring-hydroxylating dioxygenase large terminal subunit [Litorimonas taeanensis]|uniref:Phenylpropionate dioxygenase-like ring-hydroxylating dioxygenase large terminal subunit n=1 Tax=Litorimonas taeanensis TaxID=568099 RepID=A0A420WDU7_9PROT|nr:aromatic ring-hydroxylating dioxygenase subunit alpha [Litorimonas taeanensis]RKQ69158.1 phenylpropionate dioxygenase-like ring-hydroxylating dioxygenase large terminal subunit [Litorimonas taeanensis]
MATATSELVFDIWYFAGLSREIKKDKMVRFEIAGEAITIGRDKAGDLFALSDICPHRAAPLSEGQIKNDTVECPYHGWRFDIKNGLCKEIPALCTGQDMAIERIRVRRFPIRQEGELVWVYIAKDPKFIGEPDLQPPPFPCANRRANLSDSLVLNCHVDHAVIGLMDPAHGPYVHRQWWWRSEHSMHEKSKKFAPKNIGFAMVAHSPSSNSFAYKLLGGKPVTEITFQLPGIRTEHIKVGKYTVLSFTAVTPIDNTHTEIRQIFFSDHPVFSVLKPLIKLGARKFLRQDARMVDLQQMGLRHNPRLMLVEDADTQAKWYFALKKAWATSRRNGEDFINPVKAKTLKWRS